MVVWKGSLNRVGPLLAALLLPIFVAGGEASSSGSQNTSSTLTFSNSVSATTTTTNITSSSDPASSMAATPSSESAVSSASISSALNTNSEIISAAISAAAASTARSSDPASSMTTSSPAGAAISSAVNTSSETGSAAAASSSTVIVTDCGGPVDILTLLNPDLFTLPPDELLMVLTTEFQSLEQLVQTLARIDAVPLSQVKDPVAFQAYSSSFFSGLDDFFSALLGPNGLPVAFALPYIGQPCLFSMCTSQWYEISASLQAADPSSKLNPFTFVARPPCCQPCTIFGNGVQLSYWPTPAPRPLVSTLVDGAGHTFVSPSVYAVFTGLSALNLCGPVGGTYALESFSFGPSELSTSNYLTDSTLPANISPGNWTAINYADFGPQCICTANCAFDSLLGVTLTNLCAPQLSLPVEVTALDPAWAACAANFAGIFDPPIALSLAAGLSVPNTASAQPTSQASYTTTLVSPSAAPANSPTPTAPNPTTKPPPTPIDTSPVLVIASSPSEAPANSPISKAPNPTVPLLPNPIDTSSVPVIASSSSAAAANPQPTTAASDESPVIIPVVTGTTAQVLTINDQTISANTQGDFVIGTQTLTPGGPAITVSGTTISLAASPTATVNAVGDTSSSTVLGSGIIISTPASNSGAATETATASTTSTVLYTGEAGRDVEVVMARAICIALSLLWFMVWL